MRWGVPLSEVPCISLLLQDSLTQESWWEHSLLLPWRASLCGHILLLWFCDERHGPRINKPQLEELLPPVESSGFPFSLSPTSPSTEHINTQTPRRPRPNTKSKNHRQDGVEDCQVRPLEMGWDQVQAAWRATVPGVAQSKTRRRTDEDKRQRTTAHKGVFAMGA